MQKPYVLNLELYDGFTKLSHINYIAGDMETMPLTLRLLKNGKPVELKEGDILTLNFENPSGVKYARRAEISNKENGELLYSVQSGDILAPGLSSVGVTLLRGSKKISWHGFSFNVTSNGSDEQGEPPTNAVSGKGFFAFVVDENGELVILANDEAPPPLEIDETGSLVYKFGEVE